MKVLTFVAYFAVSSFVLFTGASFVSAGFSFQGTLLEVICWSLVTGVLLAVAYGVIGATIGMMFSLENVGRLLNFIFVAVGGAGVLYGLSYMFPTTFAVPDLYAALIAGTTGASVTAILGLLAGWSAVAGQFLPNRTAK